MDIDLPFDYWSVIGDSYNEKTWARAKFGPKNYSNYFLAAAGYKEPCPNLGVEKYIIDFELGLYKQKLDDCLNPRQAYHYGSKLEFRKSWVRDWQQRYNKVQPQTQFGPFKSKQVAVGGTGRLAGTKRDRPYNREEEERELHEAIWADTTGDTINPIRQYWLKKHWPRYYAEKKALEGYEDL